MLEIRPTRATLVVCMGDARTLDGAAPPGPDTGVFRVAGDEYWVIGPPGQATELLTWATARCAAAGRSAFAIDMTDAWSVCTVSGADSDEMWARLSDNAIPSDRPAFVQGALAMVPAKAVVLDQCVHVFTPAPVGHHFPQRVREACADLAPHTAAAADWTLPRPATPRAGTPGGRTPVGRLDT